MEPVFDHAGLDDVDELIGLYRRVYGRSYALPLGTDPEVMAAEIAAPGTTWLVVREPVGRRVVGSIVATVDPADRLGKLQGLVVHPDCRGGGLAHRAIELVSELLLAEDQPVDSIYATARTTSTVPQRVCLRNGFRALGIFPNLRKAARHETMVLLARYRDGVLDRRHLVPSVPAGLAGLVESLDGTVGWSTRPEIVAEPVAPQPRPAVSGHTIELVDAPRFVLGRFHEVVTDPVRRFYPFHEPNVLLASADPANSADSAYEVYAHLSRSDGYCALIGASPGLLAVADHLDELMARLGEFGASYVETLLPMDCHDELSLLLAHGFLPAAAYPAMRRDGELFRDYVVMARTTAPLDFRGLAIDEAFRPYAEQYIDLWKQKYLNTHGVFR
ncbi:N-acetyltransferase [Solihabitans fulvus]|uniref:N-acetyltransferase n=1 Tax=Solihabitans fulvus TaxID=1892852 RepID=A0A5B2WHV8_9PSEU|nr:GNAT family N-acetyltransferase [Solihabitans fulvus]KAA2250975.1 N-acetyltransferase [Solihabitans fulvus]